MKKPTHTPKLTGNSLLKAIRSNLEFVVLITYFFFSCWFYQERTSFLDNPFTIFKLINDGSFFVNANRYPAAIMQALPLLGIKLGMPLKMIMWLHSFGYFLFHSILFATIRYGLKDKAISWLLLLTLILPVTHTFFWNNNELFLGLSGLCLWLALMRREHEITAIAIGATLAWVHPLLIVIVLYLAVTSYLAKNINRQTLQLNVVAYAISYIVKAKFFPNYYDTIKNESLVNNLKSYDWTEGSFLELILGLDYWPISLFSIVAVLTLLISRQWLYAFLMVGFHLCFLILLELSVIDYSQVFYNEGNLRVLSFVSLYTVLLTPLPQKWERLKYGLGLLCVIAFTRIALCSTFYTNRITWYQEIAVAHDREIIQFGPETKAQLMQGWAAPFESIILTTINGSSHTCIFSEDPEAWKEEAQTNRQMITTHGKFMTYKEDNKYFNLADKAYRYTTIK